MNPFVSPPFLLIIILSLLSLSIASPLTPLLALNCSQPLNQTLLHGHPTKALLENLTLQVTRAQFITFSQDRFTGFMQCRPGLDRNNCTLCARNAKHTISTLCPNSDVVTAWFDGCYIQYSQNYINVTHAKLENSKFTTWSCANRTSAADPVKSELALEMLLLRLRAEVSLAIRHGISHGDLKYGSNSKVYGVVECVRSLSPKECELCIGEAIQKLNEYCGGKDGGIAAQWLCIVRFDSHQFYSETGGRSLDRSGAVSVWASGEGVAVMSWKQILVAWVLGACSIFLIVVVACLVFKRSVLKRAKVAALSAVDDEELENKIID